MLYIEYKENLDDEFYEIKILTNLLYKMVLNVIINHLLLLQKNKMNLLE